MKTVKLRDVELGTIFITPSTDNLYIKGEYNLNSEYKCHRLWCNIGGGIMLMHENKSVQVFEPL